jgi:hypothetical protein
MPDELTFERAAWRIERIMAGITVLGALTALTVYGWKSGAGFLLGAAFSGLIFRWVRKLVASLGGARPRGSMLSILRYVLLGGAAYVILRRLPTSLPAVLAGLFVMTAAVFVEVIFEIVYARK